MHATLPLLENSDFPALRRAALLHEGFRDLVREVATRDVKIIDRCNLTVLLEPGHSDLGKFLAAHRVEVVASLPCYSAKNVDSQRGDGVFAKATSCLR